MQNMIMETTGNIFNMSNRIVYGDSDYNAEERNEFIEHLMNGYPVMPIVLRVYTDSHTGRETYSVEENDKFIRYIVDFFKNGFYELSDENKTKFVNIKIPVIYTDTKKCDIDIDSLLKISKS